MPSVFMRISANSKLCWPFMSGMGNYLLKSKLSASTTEQMIFLFILLKTFSCKHIPFQLTVELTKKPKNEISGVSTYAYLFKR